MAKRDAETEESPLTLVDLEAMTESSGEAWALPHARRVRHLAELIGTGLDYDGHALAVAATLHDWGAFARYRQPKVDHGLRSAQIAEAEILPRMALTPLQIRRILAAIELHDYRDPRPPAGPEALLLREADFLDFLGVIGLAREFAWGPNDLAGCLRRLVARRDALRDRFTLPRAREIAVERLARLEQCLAWLEEESLGWL